MVGTDTKNMELVPQEHGGALRRGNFGNKGGGRPRSVLRSKISGILNDFGVGVLEAILSAPREVTLTCSECDNKETVKPPASDADRLRAVDISARYSLGQITQVDTEQVKAKLVQTLDAISDQLNEEDAERLTASLRGIL